MAYIDLSSTALDVPPPQQGQFVDLSAMQLDPPQQQPGMFSRINNDLNQGNIAQDNLQQQYNSGAISLPEAAFETMGAQGTKYGSAAMEPIKSLYNTGMQIYPQDVQNNIKSGMREITGGVNSLANSIDNTDTGKAVNGYMAQNPRVAALVNAVPGAASLLAPAAGTESATGSLVGDAVSANGTPNITQIQARALAGLKFQKANDLGAVASPSFTDKNIIGAIDAQAPKTEAGTIGKATDPFTLWAADAKSTLAGKPLSLTSLQELDGNLGDQIDKYTDRTTGFPTSEATPFIKVQQALRSATKPANIGTGDLVSGTPEALQAWKDGQGVWADSYKIGDIQRINNRAVLMPNPSQAIQVGYRQLASSPDFESMYTPAQQELIKQGATKGLAVRGLELAGSGLAPMVGALAGGAHAGAEGMGAGSMAGFAAGVPFRAMAKALQAVPGKALQENLSSGILNKFPDYTPTVPITPTAPQTLALPVPAITVSSGGVAKTAEQAAQRYGTPSGTWAARMAARDTTAPYFDALEGQPAVPAGASPPQVPVTDLINKSNAYVQQLKNELGESPSQSALQAALLRAAALKGSQ